MGNYSIDPGERRHQALLNQYVTVRLQQGVPLLDADWNEMDDIRRNQVLSLAHFGLGEGVPASDPGFGVAPLTPETRDFSISGGHCFVRGMLVLNPASIRYSQQIDPDTNAPLGALPAPHTPTAYILYLDVWEKEVESDEHPVYRKVGVAPCVRVKLVWVCRLAVDPPQVPSGHHCYPLARIMLDGTGNVTLSSITDDLRAVLPSSAQMATRPAEANRLYRVPLLKQTLCVPKYFPVENPLALASNGRSVWVIAGNNVVTVINAKSDAIDELTLSHPALAIAFAEGCMWVVTDSCLYCVDSETQRILQPPFQITAIAAEIAYDGKGNLYIINSPSQGSVTIFNINTKKMIQINVPNAYYFENIFFDGKYMWFFCLFHDHGKIVKVNTDNYNLQVINHSGDPILFDGYHVWFLNFFNGERHLCKMDINTNHTLKSLSLDVATGAFDGRHIWAAAFDNDVIHLVDVDSGIVVTSMRVTKPGKMAFDGTHMWVCNRDNNTVCKIRKLV